MSFITELSEVLLLVLTDAEIRNIALLSIFISLSAVSLSSIIGIPIGIFLGMKKKSNVFLTTLLNTAMGLPPVLIGLLVYLMFSYQGPLGDLEVLFTPVAMIIAQMILTMPIIIGVTYSTIKNLPEELDELITSVGASKYQKILTLFEEARFGIMIGVVLALGRAISEVGAIIIVGGNIRFHTRVLTTAIITEISKGANVTALALGILLLFISYSLTLVLTFYQLKHFKRS